MNQFNPKGKKQKVGKENQDIVKIEEKLDKVSSNIAEKHPEEPHYFAHDFPQCQPNIISPHGRNFLPLLPFMIFY